MYRGAPDVVVYFNGRVVTVDARDSIAGALAIKGDKTVAVGSDGDIRGSLQGSRGI